MLPPRKMKKDDDLKKKEEVSKKLDDEKPGNLVVSVVRKVIKEEQSDSNMGVETDNKEGFKDIVIPKVILREKVESPQNHTTN